MSPYNGRSARMLARGGVLAAALACAEALVGCGAPAVKVCHVDADCGGAATCQSGACQTSLKLGISSPSSGTATNGKTPLQVQVEVRGGAPAEVELVLDELTLHKIGPPYQYTWDTGGMSDGVHGLSARVLTGSQVYQSPRIDVVMDTQAPAAPSVNTASLTNASPVPVSGSAEPGATVDLFERTAHIGQAVASVTTAWATTVSLTPGAHALTAIATDAAANASPRTAFSVVVDPSLLSVVAQVPPAFPKATNVWSRDPIVVVFSKAVKASTLTSDSVKVSVGGAAVPLLPFDLSQDGTTLTLTPNPNALPPVPSDVVATLSSAISDLAGNTLPNTTWTWTIPEWLSPAYPLFFGMDGDPWYSSVLDRGGTVSVAYNTPPPNQLAFSTASGGAWVRGTGPDPLNSFGVRDLRMVVDSAGRFTVAYVSSSVLRVSRGDGRTWSQIADRLNMSASANAAAGVRLAIDSLDRPVVLWAENGQLYAKRLDANGWSLVLGPIAYSTGAYALAIGPRDVPAVAAEGTVTGYSGFHVDTSSAVSLTFDGSQQPVAAFVTSSAVRVARPGLPPASWSSPLGGPLGQDARNPCILYRAGGPPGQQLLLAYEEHASPAGMRVLAWSGSNWESISTDVGTLSSSFWNEPQCMANRSGVVAVGWTELRYPGAQFVAKRYNR